MTVGERLNNFIETCYTSQANFANETGIAKSILNKITRDKHAPSLDTMIKLKNAGLSINWLIDEEGSMFSANDRGQMLKNDLDDSDDPYKVGITKRTRAWIYENYGSLRHFSNLTGFPYDHLHKILFEDYIPNTELIRILREAGCNMDWIISGEGTPCVTGPANFSTGLKEENNDDG